jgi:hypothetical protein
VKRLFALLLLAALGCPAPGAPGTRCRTHEDCKPLPQGYCARAEICTRECSEATPCPEGSRCVAQPQRSVCLQACDGDAACPAGFTCRDGACHVTDVFAPPPPES